MPARKGNAVWDGGLKDGKGMVRTESGALDSRYSFVSRFEQGTDSNPEELLAAAHAACFSMALAADLEKAGFKPVTVSTEDTIHIEKGESGFSITRIEINTSAKVGDISEDQFKKIAEGTKENCPVARALKSIQFSLNAKLIS